MDDVVTATEAALISHFEREKMSESMVGSFLSNQSCTLITATLEMLLRASRKNGSSDHSEGSLCLKMWIGIALTYFSALQT